MIELGKLQTLTVVKTTDFGVYLGHDVNNQKEKVLLPRKQVPRSLHYGDDIEVFIYKDSEDRLIATTTQPKLSLAQVALLTVNEVTAIGAFLDWGLEKDLLLPFKEQTKRVETGDQILVSLYIDKSNRLCATMKVYDYLRTDSPYQKDDKVSGIVYELSEEFGAFVAVDNQFSALIPHKDLFQRIFPGATIEARVATVLEDGKLTLSLRDKIPVQMDADASLIYNRLVLAGGFLPYFDKTDPQVIRTEFSLSKSAFKRAIGSLYKAQKIEILSNGIRQVVEAEKV